ncbi:adenylyltransferase/cytidyltransferase family protein [Candidatus Chlorohelix sp.]|uniref:adenylyltransferase/cytidyltransferase family protein n=1 Tax=Candidatus Chlorohelix sp. TaxID=3139201 RepID=UPI0030377EAD
MNERILKREKLAEFGEICRKQGKRLIFTNGVFDLMHVGHVRCLSDARNMGDLLVVGVNSDSSTRKLKGTLRPLMPEQDRAEMLLSLRCVDYVTIFEEISADETLTLLKPALYVKGGDYTLSNLSESKPGAKPLMEEKTVKSYGGEIELIPYIKGYSTTELIEKILTVFHAK